MLNDFPGKPSRVSVSREGKDDADAIGTEAMLQQFTDKDGFHCPRCPFTTSDREAAVYHLEEEINKALDKLGRKPG